MRRLRSSLRGQGKWALLCSIALALIVAPFAVAGDGDVMKVGETKLASDQGDAHHRHQDVTTYATRQSNNKRGRRRLGDVRLPLEPRQRAVHLRLRAAHRRARSTSARSGNDGGRIVVFGSANPRANRPFTTNATGVATGLNADEVDGQQCGRVPDQDADRRGVGATGALDTARSRGVTTVAKLAGDGAYRVDFVGNISRCAYTATVISNGNSGAVSRAAGRLQHDQRGHAPRRLGSDQHRPDRTARSTSGRDLLTQAERESRGTEAPTRSRRPRRCRFAVVCRFVAYLGERVLLDEVLFLPDSSLVEQAVHPQMLSAMNLAGFGVVAWDGASPDPELPYAYRTAGLPFYDRNLRALSRKTRATALIGHVRGVLLSDREVVNEQNVHPFRYEGAQIALAMNGDLDRFARCAPTWRRWCARRSRATSRARPTASGSTH